MSEGTLDRRFLLGALGGAAGVAALTKIAQAGPLNPPAGPIAPTGKTVQEIYDKIARTDVGLAEPRIPVQSLPGSATALHVISQPGSYYLTGNIQGVAGKNGIEIRSDHVHLDLCGFAVIGVVGAQTGIFAELLPADCTHGVRICNGAVVGWDNVNVQISTCFAAAHVDRLYIADNRGSRGLNIGWGSLVTDCLVVNNNYSGIEAAEGTVVRGCVFRGNAHGVAAGIEITVEDCAFVGSGIGVWAFFGNACRIVNNYMRRCGTGIAVQGGGTDSHIDGNTVSECGTGIQVTSTRHLITRNAVAHSTSGPNYDIAPGNSYGPIVNVAGVGAITAVANANHPWANFIY